MNIILHKKARTPPAIRRKIQQSTLSERKFAQHMGHQVRKWKGRETVADYSHTPHNLNMSFLTSSQEAVVIELRTSLLLSIDDLLVVVQKFIYAKMSRSALDRCLRRHGVSKLKNLLPDEESRKYLFVAVDRATRWIYMEVRALKTAQDASSFLKPSH